MSDHSRWPWDVDQFPRLYRDSNVSETSARLPQSEENAHDLVIGLPSNITRLLNTKPTVEIKCKHS